MLVTIHELHCFDAADGFAHHAMTLLLDLVPAHAPSFNRLDMKSVHLLCQGYPEKSLQPLTEASRQNFLRFQDQHPFVSLFRETGGFAPVRTSDLMSQKQFERLPLYNEYYRRFGARFLIEFTLPAPRDVCLCFVLDRADKNFSERDRAVLTLLRPHVATAYHAAQTRLECKALEQCTDPHRGAAFTSPSGRLRYLTPSAAVLLSKYFDQSQADKLPGTISRWLAHRTEVLTSDRAFAEPPAPLRIERGTQQLEVHVQDESDGQVLLFRECSSPPSPASLVALGLTPRQAEVLYWVAQGKTNSEIGIVLGASEHTIHQHVHAILTKLGVESRACAMLRALEVLGLPKNSSDSR